MYGLYGFFNKKFYGLYGFFFENCTDWPDFFWKCTDFCTDLFKKVLATLNIIILKEKSLQIYIILGFKADLLFQLLIVALSVSIFSLYSIKQNKKFADFMMFFRAFSKFYKNKKLLNTIFLNFNHS